MEFTFEGNAELEEAQLSTVPAEFQGFYAKGQDGKFRVQDSHAPIAKVFDGLVKNLKTARSTNSQVGNESKQRREALEAWANTLGFEKPEDAKAHLDDLAAKVANNSKIKPEEIKAEVAKGFEGQLKEKDTTIAQMQASLEKHLRDGDAARAISEHEGNAKLLEPHIRMHTKVVRDEETGEYSTVVINAKGEIRAGTDGSPMTVSALVAEMKKDKDFASAFKGTQHSGGGTPPHQHQQQKPPTGGEMTPISKISQGLKARA